MSERARLTQSLQAGRPREAARLAGKLARAGAWDSVVAATIHLHARAEAPEREQARAWMAVALAAARLEQRPASIAALARTLDELLAAGRIDEARVGLRLATRAGLVDADAWLGVTFRLFTAGLGAEAAEVIEEALVSVPPTAALLTVAAQLRLAAGRWRDARIAAMLAAALDPGAPTPHVVLAPLCARAGDARGRASHADKARRLGLSADFVERCIGRCEGKGSAS